MQEDQPHLINIEQKQNVMVFWQGFNIHIGFDPVWLQEQGLVHITVQSENRQRIPVTETGYLSAYFPLDFVSEYASIEGFVIEWLDEFAELQEWQDYYQASRQLSLF